MCRPTPDGISSISQFVYLHQAKSLNFGAHCKVFLSEEIGWRGFQMTSYLLVLTIKELRGYKSI